MVAESQPEREGGLDGIRLLEGNVTLMQQYLGIDLLDCTHHFLVTGQSLSMLARSLFPPIPPTAYTAPLRPAQVSAM